MAASIALKVILGLAVLTMAKAAIDQEDMQSEWGKVSQELDEINQEVEKNQPRRDQGPTPMLTPTLKAWISSQCEGLIEEMEAIARQNSLSGYFSLVSYLRYLNLYDHLKVIANEDNVPELKWVKRKARVFGKVYGKALELVSYYIADLDRRLKIIEFEEPKSKQVPVGEFWQILYETIRYVAVQAPKGSQLAKQATGYLQSSPDGTLDRMRATRYQLKTHAFNRR